MLKLRRFRKKADNYVVAVQLVLQTEGLTYSKWGAEQRGKAGDWLVNNDGDVYTINAKVFAKTYRNISPGLYCKTTPVWAKQAAAPGSIQTKEGETGYQAGDYLVYNQPDGNDGYAVTADKFESMYEPADENNAKTN